MKQLIFSLKLLGWFFIVISLVLMKSSTTDNVDTISAVARIFGFTLMLLSAIQGYVLQDKIDNPIEMLRYKDSDYKELAS